MKLDAASLIGKWGIPAATFVYCYISGLVPIVNAEAFLIFVSAVALSKSQLLVVTALATLGQMAAKSTMYFIARTSFRRPPRKYAEKFARTRERLERWRHGVAAFFFVSSSTGFPPFYVVSILSGMMRLNFLTFLVFGAAGRFVRFGLMVLFPQLLKGVFH
jgi:membrane protein YqaA with SNARE-associated domain